MLDAGRLIDPKSNKALAYRPIPAIFKQLGIDYPAPER